MTRPASGAACPLSSTRRRSMYQVARCPDDSTKSPRTTALSLITRRRSSRSLTVGEPTQRGGSPGEGRDVIATADRVVHDDPPRGNGCCHERNVACPGILPGGHCL